MIRRTTLQLTQNVTQQTLTFPGENSCWPGTGESLLALELHGPEDTTPGDNFPLHPEVGIDK